MILSLAAAWAGKPVETEAESTWDRWASMKDLTVQVSLVRALEAPVDLQQGPERLHLEGGWLVPVFSGHLAGEWERASDRWFGTQDRETVPRIPDPAERGDQALVGFVWTGGTGTATIPLTDRADGLILANRMVRELGVDRADAAPLASGEAPLVTDVADAIVLAVDPALAAIFAGPSHRDPYEIVVYGNSSEAEKAARRARELLADRSRIWEALEHDPNERVAWDRIAVERGLLEAGDTLHWWELATGDRYGLVAPEAGGDQDRWLSVIADPTGEVDARREIRVASLGLSPQGLEVDGLVGGVPHPPSDPADPTSAPLARIRVDPVFADSTVTAIPRPSGSALDVRVDSTLTFRAAGAPAGWIEIALPKMEWVSGSFEIVTAELSDGTPLLGAAAKEREPALGPKPEPKPAPEPPPQPDPAPEPQPEPPMIAPLPEPGEAVVRLQLPAPLAVGAEGVVHLVHVDTWPYAVFAEGPTGILSLGVTSGMQSFLPTVSPQVIGSPWKFRARIAVPADSRAVGTMSGRTVQEFDRDGWRIVEVDSEDHVAWFPAVAVGRFRSVDDPAQLGFPSIRTRMSSEHYGAIADFGPEVRRVVQFYEGWLPKYPVREVEIFEAPQGMLSSVWIAPHGMVNVQQMLTLGTMQVGGPNPRSGQPHLENAILAHELAHQYWGHLAPPGSIEDFWIAESLSELYSCMYVAAAFEARDCQVRLRSMREGWEAADAPPVDASLSRAYDGGHRGPIVYDYGPYLLGEVIQRRIGREAFFGALDLLLRDHPYEPLTAERLQTYLEAGSGRSLDDAFAYWVHGGYIPSLALAWKARGRSVSGTLTADVPFGTFDVPVRVRTKEGQADVMVTLHDGTGTLAIEAPAGKVLGVEVDPDRWIFAKKRDSREETTKRGRARAAP